MDGMEIDYGGRFTEDLNNHYDEILKAREQSESYSDRVQLNHLLVRIMAEIEKRNNDYE